MKLYPKFKLNENIKYEGIEYVVTKIDATVTTIFDSVKNKYQTVSFLYFLKHVETNATIVLDESKLKLTDLFDGSFERVKTAKGREDFLNAIDSRNVFYEVSAKDYTKSDLSSIPFDIQINEVVFVKPFASEQFQILSIEILQTVTIKDENDHLNSIDLDNEVVNYNLFALTSTHQYKCTRQEIIKISEIKTTLTEEPTEESIEEEAEKPKIMEIKKEVHKTEKELDMFDLMKYAKPELEVCIEGDLPGTFDMVGQARILRKVNAGKDMPFEYFDVQDGNLFVKILK